MAEFGEQFRMTAKAVATIPIYHILRFVAAGSANQGPTTNIASDPAANYSVGAMGVALHAANSGDHVAVAIFGETKVCVGSSITAGSLFTCSASGRAVTAASGDLVVGRIMSTVGADGDIARAIVYPVGRLGMANG